MHRNTHVAGIPHLSSPGPTFPAREPQYPVSCHSGSQGACLAESELDDWATAGELVYESPAGSADFREGPGTVR